MKIFSPDNSFMRLMDKLSSIMLINICFLLFSAPIITIGASITAMYRCFLTMANDSDSGLLKLFWKSFKSNFKKATLLELTILPAFAIVLFEITLFLSGAMGRSITTLVFALPLILMTSIVSYIFPLQAQFENKIFTTIKNAGLIAIAHFPVTIVITLLNLIFPLMVYFLPNLFVKTLFVWLLFGFALIAYFNTTLLRKVFVQYFPNNE